MTKKKLIAEAVLPNTTLSKKVLPKKIFTKEVTIFTKYYNEVFLPWLLRFGDAVDIAMLIFFSCAALQSIFMASLPLQCVILMFTLSLMILCSIKNSAALFNSSNLNVLHAVRQVLWGQSLTFGLASIAGMILPHSLSSPFLSKIALAMPWMFLAINSVEILSNILLMTIHWNRCQQAKESGHEKNYIEYRRAFLGNLFSLVKATLFIGLILASMFFTTPAFFPILLAGLAIFSILLRRTCTEKICDFLIDKIDNTQFFQKKENTDVLSLEHKPNENGKAEVLFKRPRFGCSDRWELHVTKFLASKNEGKESLEASKEVLRQLNEYILNHTEQVPNAKKDILNALSKCIKEKTWDNALPINAPYVKQSFWRHEEEGSQTWRLATLTKKLLEEPETFQNFNSKAFLNFSQESNVGLTSHTSG